MPVGEGTRALSTFLHLPLLPLLPEHAHTFPSLSHTWLPHMNKHTDTHTHFPKPREFLMTLFSNPQLKRNHHVPTNYCPFVVSREPELEHPFSSFTASIALDQMRSGMGEAGQMVRFPGPPPPKKLQCLQGKSGVF